MLTQLQQATDMWLFVRDDVVNGQDLLSEQSEITAGLEEIMFLYAGAVQPVSGATAEVLPIVTTSETSGLISFEDANVRGANYEELRARQGDLTG